MTDKEQLLENYLLKISENLDISEDMRKKAEQSYRAVGKWLGDCEVDSDVKIMPQGSFYLGTVIRPVTDKDEYDIDVLVLYDDTVSPPSVLNAVRRFTNEGLSVSAQKCIPERPRCSSVIDLRKEHPTC